MRTSITHPLQIAEIKVAPGYGRVGVTFCPGKKQPHAATGAWDRDLGLDLDTIERWGAALVVTLLEDHEIAALDVSALRAEVEARHMAWRHFPMIDGSADAINAGAWSVIGPECHALLRDGFNVLVHCKGGLGRAGTIAVELLVELGMFVERAIELVREARPGAIETKCQELYLWRARSCGEDLPDCAEESIVDRALGAMLGLAIGDALGTTLEFSARDTRPRLINMLGGGPFALKSGQWTDDTAMALALMESLTRNANFDEADLMTRFVAWHEQGTYSCTGSCFDIGGTVREALRRYKASGNPIAGATDPMSAGNGSLMRLAPVAIRHWRERSVMRDVAARQSRTTHGAPEAVDACVAFAELLADAIEGRPRSQVMRPRDYPWAGNIAPIMAGSWRGKCRDAVHASGYVAHSLEAALWCVGRTSNFSDAVLLAANLGEDADTTAAITGQLAGALYGRDGIPPEWRNKLAWADKFEDLVSKALEWDAQDD
ncbi:MAG: ADP-ribosylglycohydrolase family protein [Novosphingobium sp.]|nr:ADP-ribosylglycohydrolase family protein [Novosphingobium sp.]